MVKLLWFIACLATLPVLSCSSPQTIQNAEVPISVNLNGIKVGDLRVSDLAMLEQKSVMINDVVKKGATLEAVIEHSGILSYMGITIVGFSNDHSEVSLELTEIDFTSDIIFPVYANKVGVFGLSIPFEYWDMEIADLFVVSCECGL